MTNRSLSFAAGIVVPAVQLASAADTSQARKIELTGYSRLLRTSGGYDSALHQLPEYFDGMEVSIRIAALA